MDKIIEFNNVDKSYGKNQALKDLSVSIESNKVVGLLGPNGSGKSTILKLIAGLSQAEKGEVLVKGDTVGKDSKKIVAYMPDELFLYQDLNIKDTINLFKDFYKDFDSDRAFELIDYFNMDLNAKVGGLSKGDSKKIGLITVLARKAEIYLLDEPLDGMDPISTAKMIDLIIEKIDGSACFIITSHQLELFENLFEDLIFLKDKKVYYHKTIGDIDKENMTVAEYYDEIYMG